MSNREHPPKGQGRSTRRKLEREKGERRRESLFQESAETQMFDALEGVQNPLEMNGFVVDGEDLFLTTHLPEGGNIFFQPPFWDIMQDPSLVPVSRFEPPADLTLPYEYREVPGADITRVTKTKFTQVQQLGFMSVMFLNPGWPQFPTDKTVQKYLDELEAIDSDEAYKLSRAVDDVVYQMLRYRYYPLEWLEGIEGREEKQEELRRSIEYMGQKIVRRLNTLPVDWRKYFRRYSHLVNGLGTVVQLETPTFAWFMEDSGASKWLGMQQTAPNLYKRDVGVTPTQAGFAHETGVAGKNPVNIRYRMPKSGWMS